MTEEEARERWPDLPPEEQERRRKLSIKAKERHQEVVDPDTDQRAFGGPQPGSGRPKKKRLAQKIADRAQEEEESERIMERLFDLVDSEDDRVSLRSITDITRIEAKETELQQKEQELDDKPKDEVIGILAGILTRLEDSGEIDLKKLMDARKPFDVEGSAEEEGTLPGSGDGGAERQVA